MVEGKERGGVLVVCGNAFCRCVEVVVVCVEEVVWDGVGKWGNEKENGNEKE